MLNLNFVRVVLIDSRSGKLDLEEVLKKNGRSVEREPQEEALTCPFGMVLFIDVFTEAISVSTECLSHNHAKGMGTFFVKQEALPPGSRASRFPGYRDCL